MKITPIPIKTPIVEIAATDADWDAQSPTSLLWMLQQIIIIRRFEETLLKLKAKDLIHGPVHTSLGQEGVAAGMGNALRPEDKISGTHRAHHEYLAKVLSACKPGANYDPLREGLTADMRHEVQVLLAEIMGLSEGCSLGRGGSMHLIHTKAGVAGTNAIVGGGVPLATGVAWAEKMKGKDTMTVCFFGDGALYQGVVDEASNLAKLWEAPIVFFIENNHYAVGTNTKQSCSAKLLCEKGLAYNMPGVKIDGMDPLAVLLALNYIREQRAAGWLPCYVEAQTYRYMHHAGDQPGSAFGYREKQEEAKWKERDPLAHTIKQLTRRGLIDEAGIQRLEENARIAIEDAVAHCTEKNADGSLRVRESLWPTVESLQIGIRDDRIVAEPKPIEQEEVACTREIKYSDAIAEVTGRWLERNPLCYVCGEEVANLGGGAYGATKGLPKKYPDRIRNTPIAEAGFTGLACGAAMNGMQPIVEIMFSSFALVAADQLFNQIGQVTHIYGGHVDMPLIVRTRISSGLGYGAQHCLDPIPLFQLFPGWRIVAPTNAFDYIGLFNNAMLSKSPTLIVEHQEFYNKKSMIPEGAPDHRVRHGSAKVLRQGKDVTVLAYASSVPLALQAAEGLDAEVIDLRSLDNFGMDYETIGRSLMKTGMLVTVEQAPTANSIGGKIAAECFRRYFDYFDGAPTAVNALDVPLPVSRRGEQLCLPTVAQAAAAIRQAVERKV